jgi:hypothetical protein
MSHLEATEILRLRIIADLTNSLFPYAMDLIEGEDHQSPEIHAAVLEMNRRLADFSTAVIALSKLNREILSARQAPDATVETPDAT